MPPTIDTLDKEDIEKIPDGRQIFKPDLPGRFWKVLASQKKHIQSFSVLVFVNFLVAGLGFITRVKIANTLGKESFGLFAYALALGNYGAVVVRFGLERTFVRDLAHYPARFAQLVARSLVLRGFLLVLVTLVLIIWKLVSRNNELSWGVIAVIFGTTLLALDLRAVYDCWPEMSRDAVYHLIQKSFYFALIWIMILLAPDKLSIGLIGAGTVLSAALYLFMQQQWAFRRIEFSKTKESLAKGAVKLGYDNLLVWAATIGCLSFGVLNQLVLKSYKGNAELGGYAAAWQIVAIAILLLNQVSRIGKPATARITREKTDKNTRRKFVLKYSVVMFAVASPIAVGALLCPGLILKTLFRPEYASAAGTLRILGIYIICFSLGLVSSHYVISA
jgi:O-antigen/teichoic acid export membrane protein